MAKVLKSGKSKPKGKRKGSNIDAATRGLRNERDRGAVIREFFRGMAKIDADRDALNQRASSLKNTLIKGELGLKISDVMAAYRLYNLEGQDRADYISTLKESFAALKVGDQLNFLDTVEEKDREVAAEIKAKLDQTPEAAFEQGKMAGLDYASMTENPYPAKSKHWLKWDEGYKAGLLDRLQSGPAPANAAN